ncbi:MAG: TonB family protein [Caldithrix sp.]|nr:TonB family protein [Caldithrix sp.]
MISFINAIAQGWAPYIALWTVQNTLFTILILLLLYLLRHSDARFRRYIALTGLIKLLIPPIIELPFSSQVNTIYLSNLNVIPVPTSPPVGQPALTASSFIFGMWIIIAFVLLGLILIRYVRFSRSFKVRQLTELDNDLLGLIDNWRWIRFYESELVHSPVVFGFFKHKIVLPVNWKEWDANTFHAVIVHELHHIRQKDQWINLLQAIGLSIHFFNPFVWILMNRLNMLNELVCDDAAITSAQLKRTSYARHILNLIELQSAKTFAWPVKTFTKKHKLMKTRIQYHLNSGEDAMMKLSFLKTAILISLLMVTAVIFSCSYRTAQTLTDTKDTTQETSATERDTSKVHPFFEVDVKPKMLGKVRPVYPQEAKEKGVQGIVVVTVTIDRNGSVRKAEVFRSIPELDEAALDAAKNCVFEPAQYNGQPVAVSMNIPFAFRNE